MNTKRSVGLAACTALLVGAAILAVSGQDRPGQPTRGQVWIENRGRTEAIPVVVQEPVAAVVRGDSTMPLPVQRALQAWEYQTLSIPRDVAPRDLSNALAAPGLAGWEAIGVQIVSGSNTLLVMKRPVQAAR